MLSLSRAELEYKELRQNSQKPTNTGTSTLRNQVTTTTVFHKDHIYRKTSKGAARYQNKIHCLYILTFS